jgi:hypothetical protein
MFRLASRRMRRLLPVRRGFAQQYELTSSHTFTPFGYMIWTVRVRWQLRYLSTIRKSSDNRMAPIIPRPNQIWRHCWKNTKAGGGCPRLASLPRRHFWVSWGQGDHTILCWMATLIFSSCPFIPFRIFGSGSRVVCQFQVSSSVIQYCQSSQLVVFNNDEYIDYFFAASISLGMYSSSSWYVDNILSVDYLSSYNMCNTSRFLVIVNLRGKLGLWKKYSWTQPRQKCESIKHRITICFLLAFTMGTINGWQNTWTMIDCDCNRAIFT